ncbi:MAG: T9SS type A sorting domain-containing protein [Bacteroidales bacterium]|nr:T9SS type A sorting domain-containing protein [Bacteroidales bacterium]
MIYIRKQYKNLIGPSTHKLNQKPMLKIPVYGAQPNLPPYGYYNVTGDSVGIIVLGTKATAVNNITIELPLAEMRLSENVKHEFHNLITDTKQILSPVKGTNNRFVLENLEAWGNLIYKIEPTTEPLGIHNTEEDHFRLYPTPSDDYVVIESLNSDIIESIEIFDMTLKQVKSCEVSSENRVNINISNLANGVYFVKIRTNSGLLFKQIIKNE